jgi:hypothetical protein
MDKDGMKVFENVVLKGNIQTLIDRINRLDILQSMKLQSCILYQTVGAIKQRMRWSWHTQNKEL